MTGSEGAFGVEKLGLASGVGLVIAVAIGAGVFVTTGFMAQSMGPLQILLAWLAGSALALAGTRAYAEVAALIPRSGGEYRYLSELLHPALGYLAGWGSFLVGFSAPVAVDALAAAGYAGTLVPLRNPRLVAAVLIAAFTALHAVGARSSRWTQDLLALVKLVLFAGFVALGLALGSHRWPGGTPPAEAAGLGPFAISLFYVAYAFSGWNTAVYAAEEFREPRRTVPLAMLLGCGLVALLYLLVNWVFIANLTPERARAVNSDTARITLGHLVTGDLVGPTGAKAMSALAVVVFLSAMSAMTFAGPRIFAAMARDGYLPRALAGAESRPPAISTVIQGVLAILLVYTHPLQQVLQNAGAILTLFSALTVLGLFRARFGRPGLPRPGPVSLVCAALFIALSGWMLYFGFRTSLSLALWTAAVGAVTLAAWLVTRLARRSASSPTRG
jgi:APA family basic amino acid/polyamine antiporter